MQIIGIVGIGVMGCGIVQIVVQVGLCVKLFDVNLQVVEVVCIVLVDMFVKLVIKGKMMVEEVDVIVVWFVFVGAFIDLVDCDFVVEVIVEKFDVKCDFFCQFEDIVWVDVIFVLNILLLLIMVIVVICKYFECVVGFYFFNLVLLMKVVEVIDGLCSVFVIGDVLVVLVKCMGYMVVCCIDMFGFIVNYVGCGMNIEGLCVVQESVVVYVDIDVIMCEQVGFCMGLFELMDLMGLDVLYLVMELVYCQFYDELCYCLLQIMVVCFVGGILGCKMGEGFYCYLEG